MHTLKMTAAMAAVIGLALALGGTAQAVEMFTEDFSSGTLPAALELSDEYVHVGYFDLDPAADLVDFSGGNATYALGEGSRQYVQTVDTDYSNYDFVYEATVTTQIDATGWSYAFFGMSSVEIDAGWYGEPALNGGPRLDVSMLGGGNFAFVREGGLVAGVAGVPLDDGTHRLRMTWDAGAQQADFAFDFDYVDGETFQPEFAFTRDASAYGFDTTNSRLFFGGGNGLVFDDMVVDFAPDKTIDTTNVALGKPVVYTSSEWADLELYEGPNATDGENVGAYENGSEYWLTGDYVEDGYFLLDLEEAVDIAQINLFNTHNTTAQDRGTREFEIFASNAINAEGDELVGGVSILSGELKQANQAGNIGEMFNAENGLAGGSYRYLKVVAKNWYGAGAGLNEIQVFSSTDPITSLKWDAGVDGNWTNTTWAEMDGTPSGDAPGANTSAFIDAFTVDVTANQQARRLVVTGGGGVSVANGTSLNVTYDAAFEPGTSLELGTGASFSAQRGTLGAIGTDGNATIGVTSGTLSAAGLNDGGVAGTLTKTGAGTLRLNNLSGTDVVAGATVLNLTEGALRSIGVDPFGGATDIRLAGGDVVIDDPGPTALYTYDSAFNLGHDDSGNGNDSTLLYTVAYNPLGQSGGGLDLIGDSGQMWVGPLPLPEDWTMATWYKGRVQPEPAVAGWNTLFRGNAFGHPIIVDHLTGEIGIYDAVGFHSSGFDMNTLDNLLWHHVAATARKVGDGLSVEFYIDGALVGTAAGTTLPEVEAVGNYQGWYQRFSDTIDETAIYNRALNAAEITDVMNGTYGAGLGNMSGKNFTVSAASRLEVNVGKPVTFGTLTLQDGADLTLAGTTQAIIFNTTTIDSGAKWIGFDPQVPVSFNGGVSYAFESLDANHMDITIAKTGTSDVTVETAPQNIENADFEVTGGVARLRGTDTLQSRPIKVTDGTLDLSGNAAIGSSPVELAGGTLQINMPMSYVGVADNPQAYYSFDDAGNLGNDDSGNGYSSPAYGTMGAVAGVSGTAGDFSGDDYLLPSIDVNEAELSFSMWIKTNTANTGLLDVRQNPWTGAIDRHFQLNNGEAYSYVYNRGTLTTSGADLADGEWHHLVVTLGAADGHRVYVDGAVAVENAGVPMSDFNWQDAVAIGTTGNYANYTGQMDDVAIYQRALTAAEVSGMTQRNMPMTATNLTVSAPSTLIANNSGTLELGSLTLQDGALLSVTGGTQGMQFAGTTIASGAEWVGLDISAPTSYNGGATQDWDGIDANFQPVTISKEGPGTITVAARPMNSDLASYEVAGGVLELRGTDTLNGSPITTTGGTLDLIGTAALGASPLELGGGTLLVNVEPLAAAPTAGLLLHLDAGDVLGDGTVLNDGDPISVWSDLALANGADDADALITGQPTYAANAIGGMPAVHFNGITTLGTTNSFDNYTIFTVSQIDPAQAARLIASNDNNWLLGYWGGQQNVMHANGLWVGPFPGPGVDSLPGIHEGKGVAGLSSFYADGYALGVDVATTTAIGKLSFGGSQTWGEWSIGDVAEVLIYDGALTDDDRNTVGTYLAGKYGLSRGGYLAPFTIDLQSTPLSVTDDSALSLFGGNALLGATTLTNGSLTVGGDIGNVAFSSVTIDTAAQQVGLNVQVPTDVGVLSSNAAGPVTLTKSGPADLVLTAANVAPGALPSNVTLGVQEGSLVGIHGSNPFDQAAIELSGGDLTLAGAASDTPVTFDNAVSVIAPSSITAGPQETGTTNVAVTLGGSNGLTVDADVTLRSEPDYSLDIAGALSGSGSVAVAEGTVAISGGGSLGGQLSAQGGQLSIGGSDLTVGSLSMEGGSASTGANRITVSNEFRLQHAGGDSTSFLADPGAVMAVTGSDLGSEIDLGTTVVLGGGKVSVVGPGAGPQAYYSFDDEADPGKDDSGNGYTATLLNDPTVMSDPGDAVSGKSLHFDGVDDLVSATFGGDISETAYTASLWFRAGVGGDNTGLFQVADADFSGTQDRNIYLNAGQVVGRNWNYAGGEVLETTGLTAADGAWHHVVHTFGGPQGDNRLYVDGNLEVTGTVTYSDFDWDNVINIGASWSDLGAGNAIRQFLGEIDEVYVFDRALSDREAVGLFNLSGPIVDLPTVGVSAEADSTLDLGGASEATIGDLTVAAGVTLTVDQTDVLTVANLNLGDGATVGKHQDPDAGDEEGIPCNLYVLGEANIGNSPGTATIFGTIEFDSDATLNIDIEGAANDKIEVDASAYSLAEIFPGGNLAVTGLGPITDGGSPTWGDKSLTILENIQVGYEGDGILGEFGEDPATIPASYGVAGVLPNEGDYLGAGIWFGNASDDPAGENGVYYSFAKVDIGVFQAAPGDTDGNRKVEGQDILNILQAGLFGDGVTTEANWGNGDFNADSKISGEDILALLGTGLFGDGTYPDSAAAAAAGAGVKLVVTGDGLVIDTNGATLTGFVVSSESGILTGDDAANLGLFQEDTDAEISGTFAMSLNGEHGLGDVIGQTDVDLGGDLSLAYTIAGVPGVFTASVVVPEPGTIVMLLGSLIGLLIWRRRRVA